ncbi:acetyl-CoA synthetase-like protein [Epithele typhae]|uniref:acetyl-CoA synthetase-like protein n=1 Tax=Epithele typhae TaxID=378194 RepID=UPI002007AAFB|nr:acetyl-CoA synthetase-like protein [Epithele typhae]KAH9939775.1 acetyl-CoA synthetase-like protein [Epithele typhae]
MVADPGAFKSPRALIETWTTTIPGLFEWNARENAQYPLFAFHDGAAVKTLSYAEAIVGIRHAARLVRRFAGGDASVPVAVLANTDSITFSLTSVGVMRTGHVLFPISVRNSAVAVADLMRRTECRHMLVSNDQYMRQVAEEVVNEVPEVTLHPMPLFEELFTPPAGEVAEDDLPKTYDVNAVAMILHSSGSTGHPKPIYWTHKRMVSRSTTSWYGEVDLSGMIFACHGIPMFHAQGVSFYSMAAATGLILAVFPPAQPPTIPNPGNVIQGAIESSADYVVTVPPYVEEWSQDPQKVAHMASMRGIIYGGAELSREIGDALASQGISLIMAYGCTEVGAVANIIPADPGMNWSWFSITPWIQTVLRDAGDGKFEIIVLTSQSPKECPLAATNTRLEDGTAAFSTNDLVIRHPTNPGLWRMYGRQDDQITLSNGEKTNPIPIERIIREDPRVQDCLVFGQNRFQNGVLLFPTSSCDPRDEDVVRHLVDQIWPSIQRANTFAPQHSRIFRELVLVADPAKPCDYNAKGNIRRNLVLQRYSQEIDDIYSQLEKRSQNDLCPPPKWTQDHTTKFVRTVVQRVLGRAIPDDTDVFRAGCDSLQAKWIRNTLSRALTEHSMDAAKRLPPDVVFKAPSVSALSNALLATVHDSLDSVTAATTAQDLEAMACRYTATPLVRPSSLRPRGHGKDVILITGTTGGFGCDVLAHLLEDDGVAQVYAFNRRGARTMEKQRKRFVERGLDVGLLDLAKFKMVECELDVPGFGVGEVTLSEILESVTHIMHNAWKVDWALTLQSFDPELKAVRNLLELAARSPYVKAPKVIIVSSIGILRGARFEGSIPEAPASASSPPIGMGYAEAKWVAEQMLFDAMSSAGISGTAVRLGQICGDKMGHWNEKEWFPAMIKSSIALRCLPDLGAMPVAFIPSNPTARAFAEARNSPAPVLHLSHPRPVPWNVLMAQVAQDLDLPLVPLADWVTVLGDEEPVRDAEEASRTLPALALLPVFRQWAHERGGPVSALPISTRLAEASAPTLAALPQLTADDARAWVREWRRSGFLVSAFWHSEC